MRAAEQLEVTIEEWADDDSRIVEVLGREANVLAAVAAWERYRESRPRRLLKVRHGARVVRDSRRD